MDCICICIPIYVYTHGLMPHVLLRANTRAATALLNATSRMY